MRETHQWRADLSKKVTRSRVDAVLLEWGGEGEGGEGGGTVGEDRRLGDLDWVWRSVAFFTVVLRL